MQSFYNLQVYVPHELFCSNIAALESEFCSCHGPVLGALDHSARLAWLKRVAHNRAKLTCLVDQRCFHDSMACIDYGWGTRAAGCAAVVTLAPVLELRGMAFAAVGTPGMFNAGGAVRRCTLAPAPAAEGLGLGAKQLVAAGARGSSNGIGSNGALGANGAPAEAGAAGGNGAGGPAWGDAAGVCAEVCMFLSLGPADTTLSCRTRHTPASRLAFVCVNGKCVCIFALGDKVWHGRAGVADQKAM